MKETKVTKHPLNNKLIPVPSIDLDDLDSKIYNYIIKPAIRESKINKILNINE